MKKNSILLLLIGSLVLVATGCKPKKKEITEEEYNRTRKALVGANKILVKKDAEKIAGYLKRRNQSMTETETGLWYAIYTSGNSGKAKKGDIITLDYTVKLLDGTECYNSGETGPKQFKIGEGGVESGLEEGVLLLSEGDSAQFIIPPHLAYGLVGDDKKIPSRAILVYNVKVLSITNS